MIADSVAFLCFWRRRINSALYDTTARDILHHSTFASVWLDEKGHGF